MYMLKRALLTLLAAVLAAPALSAEVTYTVGRPIRLLADRFHTHLRGILTAGRGRFPCYQRVLLSEPGVWYPLKRALRNGELEIAGYDPFYMMAGSGIKPEPIQFSVKVVLIGESYIYNMLYRLDEDFKKVFRIKAEFDNTMPLNNENLKRYFQFTRRIIDQDQLPPFDLTGLQAVAEYGRKLSGHRSKLTVRFTAISDIIREASFCAQQRRGRKVTREDVHQAIVGCLPIRIQRKVQFLMMRVKVSLTLMTLKELKESFLLE